ncbi:hypothetical protein E4U43_005505 [Claviceps pusilla]|uniref:Uncharacterized protein n=1 Tax=Claviceps pusilla TaxID=123648 RepID=A0A9P7N4G5_9HYPO|nr:hypothetical protein E4U43_005505 [Claviceps pusilla]
MTIPQDFIYQRYEDKSTYTILTSDLVLTADLIDPTKDCVIYADVLTLNESRGKLVFPGRNLTICCRSLEPNGVAISTRPPDSQKAAPAPKPRTSDDPAVNKGNPDGQHADPITSADFGGSGGNVTILAGSVEKPLTINSSGGKGRDGQKGGDAGKGADGANGTDDEEKRQGHFGRPDGKYPGSAGRNGQAGGNGGNGGKPGQGGNAGTITVSTIVDPPSVSSTAAGGPAGQPGAGGSGAAGGKGGIGGRLGEWQEVWHGHNNVTQEFVYIGRYSNGTDGAAGRAGQVVQGQDGTSAAVKVQKMASVQATIAANAQLFAQLQLMMQVVKIHYLDRDFERAKNILAWVFGLTTGRSGGGGAYAKKWDGLHQQAATYLSRLARGLDYFGNAANFLPLASFSLYSSSVTPMLVLGGTVQTVFDTYTRYLKDQTSGYDDFSNAYAAGARAIDTYKKTIADATEQRAKLWDECLALESQVAEARENMLRADQTFRYAVEARRRCLRFAAIVDLITALTGFPADIIDGVKQAKEAAWFGAAGSLAGGLPGNLVGLGKTINVLSSDFSDAQEQWDRTTAALEADGADSAKLAGDLDAINREMAEYMDMPEARAYNAAVRAYVGLCQARNMKIMECSKLDEDVLGLEAKIDQTQTQMDELKSTESGKLDPTLAPYRTFLLGLYNNYKDSLLDQLFFETTAFRYRTLKDFGQIIQSGNTLAELSVMQGQILQAVIDHQNGVGAIEQPFQSLVTRPFQSATAESVLNFLNGPGGDLVFRLPFGEASFQGLAQIQLTKFAVSLPGVQFAPSLSSSSSEPRKVYVSLRCHGDCSVVDPKSATNIFRFTHNPIMATYQYEVVKGDDGRDEEKYLAGGALVDTGDGNEQKSISLSPFCTWTMSLPAKFNVGVDLSQVSDVILSFGGKGLPASWTKYDYHAMMI